MEILKDKLKEGEGIFVTKDEEGNTNGLEIRKHEIEDNDRDDEEKSKEQKESGRKYRRKRMSKCPGCNVEHEDDDNANDTKKRKRDRFCDRCMKKHRREKRLADPVTWLASKVAVTLKYHGFEDKSLWSKASIKSVWEKFQGQCALTGETDVSKLTVIPYNLVDNPRPTDLVLVSQTKAAEIRDVKDANERRAMFPPEVLAKVML